MKLILLYVLALLLTALGTWRTLRRATRGESP